ncbi:phage baseplate assembly protein [Solidesulfovibrio carbinolicus]|uniref:Phage tail protein n=1 Tax=Solidesulfovibrio carbinolicus TaxID=296842 RepID=A0A4P6HPE9_9BACT|nr:phage tail protein [Solidesulfovibrio carbinolicus]QAZ67028.1 phage tail protein [Solidesulfovibrio carbinolicus]
MASQTDDTDRITVRLAGREHRDWTTYRIDSHLITPADAWQVTLGIPADALPDTVKPWAAVDVCLGQDVVLTGRIDRIEREVAKGTNALAISGRDGAAVMVDCSAPIFTRRKATLTEVVDLAVRPLGVSQVRVEATGAKEKVEIEPGMTAWDALAQACEANGCWAWFEPDGTLVVGGPDYTAAPVATLVMRQSGQGNNVLSLAVTEDVSGRYSEVTVLGQAHGTETTDGQHNIKHQETDADVPGYRPLILVAGDCDGAAEAKRRAQKTLMDSRLEGFTITARVRGHRVSESGKPWTPGQRIQVVSEPHGLDATYFLMARTFLGGRDKGSITELTLKEDGVWLPELAKISGGKGKGKAASAGKVVELS